MTSLTGKMQIIQPRSFNRNVFSLPIVIIFFIGFFFVSSLKLRVVYSTPSASTAAKVNSCSSLDLDCNNNNAYQESLSNPITQQQVAATTEPKEVQPKHVTHPASPKPTSYPFTIVTASSANHLCSLENFLYSLYNLRSEVLPEEFPRIVLYNIGMNRTQIPILDQFVENGLIDNLETFDYFKYPRFWDVAINAGEYAWKTGIVREASVKYAEQGTLVWLDAGNMVTPQFLKTIKDVIRKNGGFWSPRSNGDMSAWTHKGMFDYFNADPKQYAGNINCNGAALGFDVSNQSILNEMIEPWYQCGLDKNCIAPPGSSRLNHRQDQAALTFLAYRSGHKCNLSTTYYKMSTHRDHSCRSELLALDIQGKLNHPSSIDYPRWLGSNTLQLYHHPEWRYKEDQVPENLKKVLTPPADFF